MPARPYSKATARLDTLVETGGLAQHLNDPDLRVLECTAFLTHLDSGVVLESGRGAWGDGHIPGSLFVDLIEELSDPEGQFRFTLPSRERFAGVMSRLGIGEGTRVVLYDRAGTGWSTRVWWMLRSFGFRNASVLHGGWAKWTAEGREVSRGAPSPPAGNFVPRIQPGWYTEKEQVISAIRNNRIRLIYALDGTKYGGKRIPGSRTVTAAKLHDQRRGVFLPREVLQRRFAEAGAFDDVPVVTYCGSGIAASLNAFVLYLLGKRDVSVYNGGLLEWLSDPSLRVEGD